MDWNAIKDAADFLSHELKKRVERNSRYSLRKYAQSLKLSPGELSEILSRKRTLSLKSAQKISQALSLSPLDTDRLFSLIFHNPMKTMKSRSLSNDLFHVISDWYCLALLSLAETKNFKFEIGYISKRLGISLLEAKFAIEHLENVGLIIKNKNQYEINAETVCSLDEVSSEAIKKAHFQILDKAKEALLTQSIAEREFSGITFAVNPKQLPELKNELKNFMDKWTEKVSLAGSGIHKIEPTEVYHLETVLFRLTENK